MNEICSGRQPGGQLPVRLVQDREIQTERWRQYRLSEISRAGNRRLTSPRQAQTMRLTYLTQARRSVKRWKSPRWCMCAAFLRYKAAPAARRYSVTQDRI